MHEPPIPPDEGFEQDLGIVFLHPDASGPFVPFRVGTISVGRNPASSVPLEGRAVSWRHAEISSSERQTIIRDLHSTNGVFVNGARISEALLDESAVVRVGDFLGVVAPGPLRPPADSPLLRRAAEMGLSVGPALAAALTPLRVGALGPGPLVVEGEIGTGKTEVARLVHAEAGRSGAFVIVDGGSLSEVEAERRLFGNGNGVRAALDEARGGTLVLADPASLPGGVQARLGAFLARREPSAPALVIATQEPLDEARAEGRLRPELLACLAGPTVRLPPLRERLLEIPALFRRVLDDQLVQLAGGPVKALVLGARRAPQLSTELVERLCLYDWPCNIREMALVVRRLLALHGDEPLLRTTHLPARMLAPAREKCTARVTPVPKVDLPSLLEALREANGHVGRAALRLGISRERAYRLIDRLGVQTSRAEV
jgi:transcriptional regulator of acetoin/glycerol metabolism